MDRARVPVQHGDSIRGDFQTLNADNSLASQIVLDVFGWVGFLALILVVLIYVYRD